MKLKSLADAAAVHHAALKQTQKQLKQDQLAYHNAEDALSKAITAQINEEIGHLFSARVTLYKKD